MKTYFVNIVLNSLHRKETIIWIKYAEITENNIGIHKRETV